MPLTVKPTRMELLKLKKRIEVARHGHDLLEERRNELMKNFLGLIKECSHLRKEVEEKLGEALQNFLMARCLMPKEKIEEALMCSAQKLTLKVFWGNPFTLPRFDLHKEGDLFSYGFVDTTESLDISLTLFSQVLPLLLRLSQLEAEIKVLAKEIERTRRRVNALEYVLIPRLEGTIKYITMKLDELERSHLIMLMKMKNVMRK